MEHLWLWVGAWGSSCLQWGRPGKQTRAPEPGFEKAFKGLLVIYFHQPGLTYSSLHTLQKGSTTGGKLLRTWAYVVGAMQGGKQGRCTSYPNSVGSKGAFDLCDEQTSHREVGVMRLHTSRNRLAAFEAALVIRGWSLWFPSCRHVPRWSSVAKDPVKSFNEEQTSASQLHCGSISCIRRLAQVHAGSFRTLQATSSFS